MAIEINQKLERGGKSSATGTVFLIIAILFLVLSVAGYFYLQALNKKAESGLANYDQQMNQMRSDDVKNTEKDVFAWSQKIKDYNIIFNSHIAPSNILMLLERDTHPSVRWDGLQFIAGVSNNSNLTTLDGTANDFTSLQQQLLIFIKDANIQNIKLTNVELTKDLKIKFEISLVFTPGVLNLAAE